MVAQNIKDRSKGSIEIQVATGGSLPTGKDSLSAVVRGDKWISSDGVTFLGDYVPDFAAVAGPMLYNNFDEYNAMLETDLVKGLVDKAYKEHGIKILALNYIFGFRSLATNKVIKTPDDLKGMKIRVPDSQAYVLTLRVMGANPTPMPFTELYAAMQQKVVDGLEGANSSLFGTKIYEVVKNVALTKHILGVEAISMSAKVFESLSPEQQTIIQEEFTKGAKYNNDKTTELDEEYVANLKKAGVVFNEVDLDAFRAKIPEFYSKLPNLTPGNL